MITGAALFASAAIFAAAALAGSLADYIPLYAALLCSALLLIVIASACFFAAGRERHSPHIQAALPTTAPHQSRIPDIAFQLLESEIRARPGNSATAAVVAGLILGALEAIEKRRS